MPNVVNKFSKNIAPYVHAELVLARRAREQESVNEEFRHLENAHVLGQSSTYWHIKVHLLMLVWGLRNGSVKEVIGQMLRVIGAATKTAMGLVPVGNTGGTNVSPFRPMPLTVENQQIIEQAKAN